MKKLIYVILILSLIALSANTVYVEKPRNPLAGYKDNGDGTETVSVVTIDGGTASRTYDENDQDARNKAFEEALEEASSNPLQGTASNPQ